MRQVKRTLKPYNGIQYIIDQPTRKELQPFVFFDAGRFQREDNGFAIGMHPHSGIGIITLFHGTDLHHKDSADNDGVIHDGGAQWINAGQGIWHEEGYRRKHDDKTLEPWTGSIHQLWIQLPPELEESTTGYQNLQATDIPVVDHTKVITGTYKNVEGKLKPAIPIIYLDTILGIDEAWSYEVPDTFTKAFIFVRSGNIEINAHQYEEGDFVLFDEQPGGISVIGRDHAEFILVMAKPTDYPIITKGGQIHTNQDSLNRSLENIGKIGKLK